MKKEKKLKKEEVFQTNNYAVVREFVSYDMANFAYTYFQNKRTVNSILQNERLLSPFDESWGTWKDKMIPNTYSHYGDLLMDTLMVRMTPLMSAITKLELIPTYSYARIYKHGDTLHRHKDRPSCEISATLNLGGDDWPIFLDPTGDTGQEGVGVILKPGDALIYKGTVVEHWREAFQGYECGQVFFHYNDKNGSFGESNIYDGRPFIGVPQWKTKL
jgi:hypothetical protein